MAAITAQARTIPLTCEQVLRDYRPRRRALSAQETPSTPFRHLQLLVYKTFAPYIGLVLITTLEVASPNTSNPAAKWEPGWPIFWNCVVLYGLAFGIGFCCTIMFNSYWTKKFGCTYSETYYWFVSHGVGMRYCDQAWYQANVPEIARTIIQLDERGEVITNLQRQLDGWRSGVNPLGESQADIERIIERIKSEHPGLARL